MFHLLSLQNYVREQMLQAVAVIFKRGTVDTPSANRENLFNDITQLISSGNISMVRMRLSTIKTQILKNSSTMFCFTHTLVLYNKIVFPRLKITQIDYNGGNTIIVSQILCVALDV